MFILKKFKLFRMNTSGSVDSGGVAERSHTCAAGRRGTTWRTSMVCGAPSYGGSGGLRSGRLNETIITYLGNLSISNYKWFRCYGIDDGKVETRNVKVETGRAERAKPRTLCKTNPQRVRNPGASRRVKGRPPANLGNRAIGKWGCDPVLIGCTGDCQVLCLPNPDAICSLFGENRIVLGTCEPAVIRRHSPRATVHL